MVVAGKVGIVILNYNSFKLTVELVNALIKMPAIDEICVVDNNSNDNFEGIFSNNKVHYIKNKKNDGYAAGNNVGLKYLVNSRNCDIVFIANPDTIFTNDTILKVKETLLLDNQLALISTKRFGPNKALIHQYFSFPSFWQSICECFVILRKLLNSGKNQRQYNLLNQANNILYVDAVPGAFFGMRAKFLIENNYLCEETFLYCEELILGQQAKNQGYKAGVINDAEYIHNHTQIHFTSKNYYKLDHDSLRIYFTKFGLLNHIQLLIYDICVWLGYLEYKIMFNIANLKRKV